MSTVPVSAEPKRSIGVAPGLYNRLIKALGSKKSILYQFGSDAFKTKIYMKDGVLHGRDPEEGERRIMKLDAADYKNIKSTSFKGILISTGASLITEGKVQNLKMDDIVNYACMIDAMVQTKDFNDSVKGLTKEKALDVVLTLFAQFIAMHENSADAQVKTFP